MQLNFEKHIDKLIGVIVEYTPQVIIAIIVLIVGMWLINRISHLAQKAMVKRDLDISLQTFLSSLLSIGLKVILIVTVAGMLGIGTASFVTILGAAGLAVGLALQGSLSNFAGGVLILIFKPFKVGDTIEAQGQIGEVKEIQIFNTLLLTADHKIVILPNGVLSNNTIVNNTRSGQLRIDVHLTVSTDNNLDAVKTIILKVLSENQKILKDPEPQIFVGKIADGAVNLNVKPFCLPDNTSSLMSELYDEIKLAFDQNNIKPPIPKRQVQSVTDATDF